MGSYHHVQYQKNLMIQSWENLVTDTPMSRQTDESDFIGRCTTNTKRTTTLDSPMTSLKLNLFLNSVISKYSSKFEDKFYFGFSFPVILKLSVKFYQSRIKALSRKLYNSTIFRQGSQKIASLPFLPIPEQSIWCLKVCNVKLFLRIPKPEFAQLNRW